MALSIITAISILFSTGLAVDCNLNSLASLSCNDVFKSHIVYEYPTSNRK